MGWFFQLKMQWRDPFTGIFAVLYPMFFATVAFLMFRIHGGAAVAALRRARRRRDGDLGRRRARPPASAMQRERWHGTLEVLVASPSPFALILLPVTVAMATIGLYCMVATLLWGRLAFGIDFSVVHWPAFVLAVPATVISIGCAGFLLAVSFVRYRTAWALGNLLEYPGLADLRLPRAARAAARLGAADLVAARADLGHERDPPVGARRDAVARRSPCASRWARVRRARRSLVLERALTAARARAALSLT